MTVTLDAILRKGVPFRWGKEENEAFEELQQRFCEAPLLRQWDPEMKTFVETDCSGFALGGVLAQEDEGGKRHAVAYYSRRLTPAEYNYPIHDKEMLAIMQCLAEWDPELRSCGTFTILTDHRNLRYFMTRKKLSERQSRWAGDLAPYDFRLEYRPGKEAAVPDALSRTEQDQPRGIGNEREQGRVIRMIPDRSIPKARQVGRTQTPPKAKMFEEEELQELWDQTIEVDEVHKAAFAAVQTKERVFPPALGLKVQIAECAIDGGDRLIFRDRIWVPGGTGERDNPVEAQKDTLRTRIVQDTHDQG